MAEHRPDPSRARYHAARMFRTRSQSWREAGLLRQISPKAVRRARFEALLLLPLFIGIYVLFENREALLGKKLAGEIDLPVRIVAVVALMIVGWEVARAFGRAFGPMLFRRLEPATAGTVGFIIRLVFVAATFIVALYVAGVQPRTLALGGAFTAVIVGLAAQQTLGNVIAGTMLLSTRPFRVGDRVRLQGGMLGGPVDGVVGSLGLFYTTFASGEDEVMIPNGVLMNALIIVGEESVGVESHPHLGYGLGHRLPDPPQHRGAAGSAVRSQTGQARSPSGEQGSESDPDKRPPASDPQRSEEDRPPS